MKTRQFLTRSIRVAIAIGALGGLVAAARARALDQSAWLQEQPAISDGGSYMSFVPGPRTGGAYKTDAQSARLQGQLAISDSSAPSGGRIAEAVYGGGPSPSDAMSNKQFAYVERALQQSDGCNE